MELVNRPDVGEVNGLADAAKYHAEVTSKMIRDVEWTEKGLMVTRFRLVSDPGFPLWDVSYCHGILNGEPVNVVLPFSQLPKKNMRSAIVKAAIRDGVYARGLGILDNISTLC